MSISRKFKRKNPSKHERFLVLKKICECFLENPQEADIIPSDEALKWYKTDATEKGFLSLINKKGVKHGNF